MAKLYGQLVGAPVQGLLTTGAGLASNDFKDSTDLVLWRDFATTRGNVIGDQVSMGLYPSRAWLDPVRCQYVYDAFGAGCTLNIGDATHPSGLVAARNIAAVGAPLLFAQTTAAAVMSQPLWQRLGWASDPGGQIELLATFAGANPANANLGWQFFGRRH